MKQYLETLISEKAGHDIDQGFTVIGPSGENHMTYQDVVDAILGAPRHEQKAIRANLVYIDSSNFDLLVKAATFVHAPTAEYVWVALQNFAGPWAECTFIKAHTKFPRSMDIGDVIVWGDGTRQRCASMGFDPIPRAA